MSLGNLLFLSHTIIISSLVEQCICLFTDDRKILLCSGQVRCSEFELRCMYVYTVRRMFWVRCKNAVHAITPNEIIKIRLGLRMCFPTLMKKWLEFSCLWVSYAFRNISEQRKDKREYVVCVRERDKKRRGKSRVLAVNLAVSGRRFLCLNYTSSLNGEAHRASTEPNQKPLRFLISFRDPL